jgi:hypothetical protein
LFESALESHEKNHETSPERAKDEHDNRPGGHLQAAPRMTCAPSRSVVGLARRQAINQTQK